MADNIKIVGNILNTTSVSYYDSDDVNLIPSIKIEGYFGGENDYIEFYLYDIAGNLLRSNYNYLDYKLPKDLGLKPGTTTIPNTTDRIPLTNSGIESTLAEPTESLYPTIEIDPIQDIQNNGYSSGEFKVGYNMFHNILSNYINQALFIKEISKDRTELRLASVSIPDSEIETTVLSMIDKINNSPYYIDYLLNFGNNTQAVAINVALNKASNGYEILFKLYQPLPLTIQEKQTLWVVEEKTNSYVFDVNLDKFIIQPAPQQLRGPNFGISIPNQGTVSTTYTDYSTALLNLQALQSSSYQQLLNLMTTQSVQINVNYTVDKASDFNNFIFFGSAYKRVSNFYTKIKQIEDYTNLINKYKPRVATTASLQAEINSYSSSINDIISQFDGYESYLYFESSSYTWPKSGPTKPYILLSTGSTAVRTWYNALTSSAKTYDLDNYDNLEYAVPSFIRDDENNNQYLTFLNMVGHYFDNIWIYLKAITDINLANNNLNVGISKDLVYNQLQSLGIKLYNSQAGEELDQFLIGANTGSNIFNNNFSITSSFLNNIPRKDLVSELYKRIYHNLPLLLKTKGTTTGLEYLISTFGIPNQTYYVSGSETLYTPSGSNFTSSILNVKEYGGSLKANLIKGYNNEKVRIVQNTITGSVLSPLLSLQTYPTASSAFRENDSHYVDISFSPESQIDTYISGAISSNNPTWRLDDYIGDPRQQYSESYDDLDNQRKLYFQTGVPGFAPFTGSSLDYNGFIRLIQYFDNALFKMLGDFVPERTSLSTGITIDSPVLERNKVAHTIPTATQNIEYTAEYAAPILSTIYDNFYNNLPGDKDAYYTGELSGSKIDVYHYFEDSNPNPYLTSNANNCDCNTYSFSIPSFTDLSISYVACGDDTNTIILEDISAGSTPVTIYKSIKSGFTPSGPGVTIKKYGCSKVSLNNQNLFNHSDFNVLLNNISGSRPSLLKRKVDWIYGTTGSILVTASLQDSYESLTSYQMSRHNGVQLFSQKYNTFTGGDISFGKSAVIERRSNKFAWVKNIPTINKNFYDKTSITIKYLVDENGSLNELSQANRYLFEVQNIFKTGTPTVISLTDPQKFSNQTLLNGSKTIFDGGFSYSPILYRENNDQMTFQYINPSVTVTSAVGIKAVSSGSRWVTNGNGDVYFDTPTGQTPWGGLVAAEVYQIKDNATTLLPNGTKYSATLNSSFNWDTAYGNRVTNVFGTFQNIRRVYTFQSNQANRNPYVHNGNNQYWPDPQSWPASARGAGYWSLDFLNFIHTGSAIGGYFNGTGMDDNMEVITEPNGERYTLFTAPRASSYKVSLRVPLSILPGFIETGWGAPTIIKVLCIVEKQTLGSNTWVPQICTTLRLDAALGINQPFQGVDSNQSTIWFEPGRHTSPVLVTCVLDNYQIALNTGDKVRIKPFLVEIYLMFIRDQEINFTVRHDGGNNVPYLQITDINNSTTAYADTGSIPSLTGIYAVSGSDNKSIVFTPSASLFYNQAIYLSSGSSISASYTSIDDSFILQAGDVIRFGSFYTKNANLYTINQVYPPQITQTTAGGSLLSVVNSPLIVRLDQSVDTSLALSGSDFAILRRKPDETSIIVDFLKNPGETSQALLLPEDLLSSIKDKAANIAASISQDLNQL
jgi:hypothetical protein